MSDFPREDLIRANLDRAAASISDGRTMTGYPIVFNTWTTIRSYEGEFKERIAPDALKKTLRESKDRVKVMFNHGLDPSIGEKPLGRPSVMRTDAHGLYVEVPLSETSYNEDLIALMRDGAIDGMSFRFSVVNEQWDTPKRGLPERTITELKLFELGPVTMPAYAATSVGIRSSNEYTLWRNLSTDKRAEVAQLLGFDLRTLGQEPDLESTPEESRDEHPDEPLTEHSEAVQIPRPNDRRHEALRALRQERARALGAIQ